MSAKVGKKAQTTKKLSAFVKNTFPIRLCHVGELTPSRPRSFWFDAILVTTRVTNCNRHGY